MGTGGIGGYFGGRLAEGGAEVAFIARGKMLEALRKDGLRIRSQLGDLHLKRVVATDDPRELAPVDLVVFGVKLWDTEEAARLIKPLISGDTAWFHSRTASTKTMCCAACSAIERSSAA